MQLVYMTREIPVSQGECAKLWLNYSACCVTPVAAILLAVLWLSYAL